MMNSGKGVTLVWLVFAAGIICTALALNAQVQTQTTTTAGHPTREVKVDRAEVVYVSGDNLVLKMEDGTLEHLANVPESDKITVDGKEIGFHDVKVGMKLQRTVTVVTTPKVVTTVQSVTGKVFHVIPPTSVILTLEDGSNQQFKIPKDQKFNVDGQMVDAFHLKKGMRVTATKVVEVPVTEVEHQKKVTGSMPPPPPPPPAELPILVAAKPTPPPPPESPAPATLPKTGSFLPLYGLLGMLSLVLSLGLRVFRKSI